jgi:hypothetical protein
MAGLVPAIHVFGTRERRKVGKGAFAPCLPSRAVLLTVGTLRFAHPTASRVMANMRSHSHGEFFA